MTGELWLITGVQAAGKSTVADLLARRFERGAHVRGDVFRRFGVTGWVDAGDPDRPDDARRLLDLRYGLAGHSADAYCAAGFTTVVQDNIYGPDVTRWLAARTAPVRHLVVLRPSIAVVEARDSARLATTGKVAYHPGGLTAADLDDHLARTPGVGLWLDTSHQTPTETVDEILLRQADAVVPRSHESGRRSHAISIAEEVASLEADVDDRDEMLAVADAMELQAPVTTADRSVRPADEGPSGTVPQAP